LRCASGRPTTSSLACAAALLAEVAVEQVLGGAEVQAGFAAGPPDQLDAELAGDEEDRAVAELAGDPAGDWAQKISESSNLYRL